MSNLLFSFKNIDKFVPGRFEQMGMLKGKRWYSQVSEKGEVSAVGLFKPQRKEFGDKHVFCGNHYGEFMGYVAAIHAGVPACRVELAHLSRYYENMHKARYRATFEEKYGCITYSEKQPDQEMEHGTSVIAYFKIHNPEEYEKITENDSGVDKSDNLEVCLSSIEYRTRQFYKDEKMFSREFVEEKVQKNKKDAIRMIVYDCMYGNNDRHDENWALVKDRDGTDISLYKLYDNERVFGLYENQNFIEHALSTNTVEEASEKTLFSRMHIPGATRKYTSYKVILEYLMKKYPLETREALSSYFDKDTQFLIQASLKSCEGLPDCYIEFQKQMYKARLDFAKGLYAAKSTLTRSKESEERENEELR